VAEVVEEAGAVGKINFILLWQLYIPKRNQILEKLFC
jgi:hypothetical protein